METACTTNEGQYFHLQLWHLQRLQLQPEPEKQHTSIFKYISYQNHDENYDVIVTIYMCMH